jgi:threonine/homoserine/homoserine lactone efflux protein
VAGVQVDTGTDARGIVPDYVTYCSFLGVLLAWQIVPGSDALFVVGRGLAHGRRSAFWVVLGMTAGAGILQLPLLIAGVASILAASPFAFELLRWGGVLSLIWLGGRLLLRKVRHDCVAAPSTAAPPSKWQAMREGILVNLINPNPLVFMVAFLPQFVDPHRGSVALQLLILGITQKTTGLAILGAMALSAGTVRYWLARHPRLLVLQERFAGLVILVLAVRLLFEGRPARP